MLQVTMAINGMRD